MSTADTHITARTAPDPLLDPARLAVLRELDLLGAPPVAGLSRLARLASRILGVPIAALSLIAWDRQITAGQTGLAPDDTAEVIDTPLSHSFCQHVVRADAPFAVVDARQDDLVADNLAIRDSGIIAYAGVPVHVGGQCVGAFCACAKTPRMWSDDDMAVLTDLAAMAVDLLELERTRGGHGLRDALTGLPRRALFTERVAQQLARAERTGDPATVVAVDLRAFRLFNEAWGHEAGDAILVEVARRLGETMGGTDRLCRLAGDEFLIVDPGIEEPEALIDRLTQMLASPPLRVAGVDQPLGALFVATRSTPGVTASEFVDAALEALATAKAHGSSSARPAVMTPALDRWRLRGAIVGAERRGELEIHYQPILDLQTGWVRSLEALLRWNHPVLGPVAAADFIPVAESTGAIVPIGEWVLRAACRDLARWRAEYPGRELQVAVNVAPEQVRLPSFDAAVGGALAGAHLPASALSLEITERTLLQDHPVERRTINALRARGVGLHLDDFGTGYSSLAYLTQFPLEVLKIDRMFVTRLGLDRRAEALVAGIVAVAHSLGLRAVAEGIETPEQQHVLAELGCDEGQGYVFARPSPAADVPALLARQFT